MKTQILCKSLWLSFILSLIGVITVHARTMYVPDDYKIIQEAVEASAEGDTIIVRDGVYTTLPGRFFIATDERGITIRSENGPEKCILDGNNEPIDGIYIVGASRKTLISGFTVVNCVQGIRVTSTASPIISNCIIKNNYYEEVFGGAGVYLVDSSPLFIDCIISGNRVPISSDWLGGGGVCCCKGSSPTFINCAITGNSANRGGGISGYGSKATLINCIISDNTAKGSGGGLFWDRSSAPTIIGCLITGNKAPRGAGIHSQGSLPVITNCTVSMNDRDGIRCPGSEPVITNSIIWDNVREIVKPSWGKPKSHPRPVVSYSNIKGGHSGEGNIDKEPGFIDPGNGDFRLGKDSPCINAGKSDVKDLPDTDAMGSPRIVDGAVDMGAYEYPGISSADSR